MTALPLEYPEARLSLGSRFIAFHEANPHLYDRLVAMARQLRARGRDKIGIAMLFEVLRWEHETTTDDPTSYLKLNNSYRSFYARLIMTRERDLAGCFEIREQR